MQKHAYVTSHCEIRPNLHSIEVVKCKDSASYIVYFPTREYFNHTGTLLPVLSSKYRYIITAYDF